MKNVRLYINNKYWSDKMIFKEYYGKSVLFGAIVFKDGADDHSRRLIYFNFKLWYNRGILEGHAHNEDIYIDENTKLWYGRKKEVFPKKTFWELLEI